MPPPAGSSPSAPRHVRRALLSLIVLPLLALSAGRVAAPLADAAAALAAEPGSPPPSIQAGQPGLALTWTSSSTHVGAPARLSIQTHDAQGQPAGRTGTALVLVDDGAAVLTPAGSGQAVAATPVSANGRTAQQATVAVSGGQALLDVTFTTPGAHTLTARMQDDPSVGGASGPLPVRDTFLVVQGRPNPGQAATERYTIIAQDAQGQPVAGYARPVVLQVSDPTARVVSVADATQKGDGRGRHAFKAADQGRVQFDVTFSKPGSHAVAAGC
jgi:hypothetical protein